MHLKKSLLVLLLLSFVIFSCSTAPVDLSSLSKVHQLDDAANFLMMVSDGEKDFLKTCSISPEEALNMLRPLHAMIDEEIQKGSYDIGPRLKEICQESCHCGIYSDLARDTKIKEELYKKAQTTDKNQILSCAKKTSEWFCQSTLFTHIKSESNTLESSGL